MGKLNGYGFRIVFACMKKALAEVRKCLIFSVAGVGHDPTISGL